VDPICGASADSVGGMPIHVLYRSYGGENTKDRPSFYDKRRSLASFLRAVAQAPDVDVTFMNNDVTDERLLELMRASGGRIVNFSASSMRPSYRFTSRFAMDSEWPDDDFIFMVEDDYLHLPHSVTAVCRAIEAMPEVDYFFPYGSTDTHPAEGTVEEYLAEYPPDWRPQISTQVDGQWWRPGLSGTSTHAVRLGAMRKDYGIILQAHLPYRHMFLDHAAGLVWQGYKPYRWRDIAREALFGAEGGWSRKLRVAAETPFKIAFNLRSHRRPENRRLLYVAEPNLITHVEEGCIAPGHDWVRLAEETDAWLAEGGVEAVRGAALRTVQA
jgi:hypothetical protein